jgi:hypothetical protein
MALAGLMRSASRRIRIQVTWSDASLWPAATAGNSSARDAADATSARYASAYLSKNQNTTAIFLGWLLTTFMCSWVRPSMRIVPKENASKRMRYSAPWVKRSPVLLRPCADRPL